MHRRVLRIGDHIIDPPLVLAPMAGLTHLPFRRLLRELGRPGLFFTEMLSAPAVCREDPEVSPWLQSDPEEAPIAFQIFAATAEDAAAATARLVSLGHRWVDLNLSCPAPEIAKKRSAGAHLLDDLSRVTDLLAAMKTAGAKPCTAKIRLGRKVDRGFLETLGQLLVDSGVDAITLHPRLVNEKLKRRARWEAIGWLQASVPVPVIGNGDIRTPEDSRRMMAETACPGVMIGREAVRRPWIFRLIEHPEQDDPTAEAMLKIFLRMISLTGAVFSGPKAVGRIKAFCWYFSENLLYGHHFASLIQNCHSLEEMVNVAETGFLSCAGT